jgi:pyruvate dehydrogenase E2 component (dihydrolipoamide acetyltransferase)
MSPKARRLASEHGLDPAQVAGSGIDGAVLAGDVVKAADDARAEEARNAVARVAAEEATRATAEQVAREQAAREQAAREDAVRAAAERVFAGEAAHSARAVEAETSAREHLGHLAAAERAEREQAVHEIREAAERAQRADTAAHASAVAAEAAATVADAARAFVEAAARTGSTIPHIVLTRTIDATALQAACERLAPRIEASHRVRLSTIDLIIAAVARGLRQHPRMNASWINRATALNHHVNVALALSNDTGVVPAVIRNTDRAALGDVARRRRDLIDAARSNRLQHADIMGATFSVSDLGAFNVDACTAVIIPPQAGILAVGSIAERVVAVDGLIGVRPTVTLTLSVDHRVVDGARAAAFLNDVATALTEPHKWT